MKDENKTKAQLIEELNELRQRTDEWEVAVGEKQQTVEELHKVQRHFDDAQQLAHLGIWVWDIPTGKVEWTDEVYRIFGLDPKTFDPDIDSVMSRFHPEDQKAHEEVMAQAIAHGDRYDFDVRIVLPDGSVRYIVSTSKGHLDEAGNLLHISGTVQDITERKQAEEALRESEERLHSVVETSPDHILMLDTDLKIQFANYASPGLTVEELIGTPIYHYVEEEQQAEIKAILEGVVETGTPARYETEYHTPRDVIYYETRVAPRRLSGSDEIIGLTMNARDITEQKQSAEALFYRLQVEKMANEIAASFVNTEMAEIDETITSALETIARFAGVNRSSLFLLSDDLETITNTHEWCTNPEDSQIALLQDIPFSTFGYHREGLLQHRTISISKLEDFPSTAKGEREWMEKHGFRSLLFVPLLKQRKLRGTLGFYGGVGDEVAWSSEFVDMLRLTGNLLLNVLERKQVEEKLAHESRLRDADNAIRIAVASINDPRDLEGVIFEVSNQLTWLGVAHDALSLQIMNTEGTDFFPVGSYTGKDSNWSSFWDSLQSVAQDGTISFREAHVEVTEDVLENASTVIDVWKKGGVRYEPCAPERWGETLSGRAILDVAFSHGTLAINSEQPSAFSEEDIVLLQRFAKIISEGFDRFVPVAHRKQAEEELQRQKEWLEVTLSSIGDAVMATDTSETILFMNPVAEALTGWTIQEALGKNVNEVFHIINEQTRQPAEGPIRRVLEEGLVVSLANHTALISRDGREISIADSGAPIVGEDGSIQGVVLVFRDVTERKQAEEAIRVNLALQRVRNEVLQMETEDDWDKVVHSFYEEVKSLVDFNASSINLVDLREDKMTAYAVGPKKGLVRNFRKPVPLAVVKAMERGHYEYRRTRRDPLFEGPQSAMSGINSIIDVPFAGGTLAVNSTQENAFNERDIHILEQFSQVMSEAHRRFLDITERKHMEQELIRLERLRAVGELSAGVSHNLNNILTTVLGPAQILKRQTNDPELLREVDDIITSATRARDLVHELHLSVRTQEEESLTPVSVDHVVQQAVQTSRPRWKDEPEAQGLSIEMVTRWGGVPSIQGTEAGLHDILTNFIFNAIDAMPEGGTITIQTETVESQVQITFSDTGEGMDEETKRRIFEPFFTTKMDIGTGLGLSTVYGTVNRWGGTIEVDSTPGEGTTFTLRFPVWTEEVVEEERKAASQSTRPGKILVVDDDEAIGSLLSRLLGEQHEVEAVTDGPKALAQFTQGKYDVAMIDLGMSGMSGDQLLRQIKELDPQVATVLSTGWALPGTDVRVSSFDFQITKPFEDLDEIEDVVARAIALRDQRVEEGTEGG